MFICTPAFFTYVLIFACNRFIIAEVCFDSCCLYQRDHNRRPLVQYFVSSQHSLEMFIVSLCLCVCRRISEIWKANTTDKSNFQLFFSFFACHESKRFGSDKCAASPAIKILSLVPLGESSFHTQSWLGAYSVNIPQEQAIIKQTDVWEQTPRFQTDSISSVARVKASTNPGIDRVSIFQHSGSLCIDTWLRRALEEIRIILVMLGTVDERERRKNRWEKNIHVAIPTLYWRYF